MGEIVRETEYLTFRDAGRSSSGKTKIWDLMSRQKMAVLGRVTWYGPWRQYAFFPEPQTIFNRQCLKEIAQFLEDMMKARK